METPKHLIDTGHWLEERDVDLRGRVLIYGLVGTGYEIVRTERGWRARVARHGNARRRFQGPAYESAPQVVAYLQREGYLRSPD